MLASHTPSPLTCLRCCWLSWRQGKHEDALSFFQRAMDINTSVGESSDVVVDMQSIAQVLAKQVQVLLLVQ